MSTTMKVIVHTKYGTPDVLQMAEVAKPTPGPNEVLVQVMATAVNPADLHVLSGSLRFSTGYFKPKQPILGSDIAGKVAAVGATVRRFQVGDAVFGDLSAHGRGGFAEYVAAPESALVHQPQNLSFAEAAAVPMTAVTALQGLRDKGALREGETVLINGASGGVGTFAVQIAKLFGAEVTAVASTKNIDLLQRLGADHIIDYTKANFTQLGKQYDLIFDTVGNYGVAEYKRVLGENGRFVTTAFLPALMLRSSKQPKMVNLMASPNQADLAYLATQLEARHIQPIIDRCYQLAETAVALRYLSTKRAKGKVVITQ